MATYAKLIEGLEIFAKYTKGGKDVHDLCAEHDIIYAGMGAVGVTADDSEQLHKLGWFKDKDSGSWAIYV